MRQEGGAIASPNHQKGLGCRCCLSAGDTARLPAGSTRVAALCALGKGREVVGWGFALFQYQNNPVFCLVSYQISAVGAPKGAKRPPGAIGRTRKTGISHRITNETTRLTKPPLDPRPPRPHIRKSYQCRCLTSSQNHQRRLRRHLRSYVSKRRSRRSC